MELNEPNVATPPNFKSQQWIKALMVLLDEAPKLTTLDQHNESYPEWSRGADWGFIYHKFDALRTAAISLHYRIVGSHHERATLVVATPATDSLSKEGQ